MNCNIIANFLIYTLVIYIYKYILCIYMNNPNNNILSYFIKDIKDAKERAFL
jgi:hypothetical protein